MSRVFKHRYDNEQLHLKDGRSLLLTRVFGVADRTYIARGYICHLVGGELVPGPGVGPDVSLHLAVGNTTERPELDGLSFASAFDLDPVEVRAVNMDQVFAFILEPFNFPDKAQFKALEKGDYLCPAYRIEDGVLTYPEEWDGLWFTAPKRGSTLKPETVRLLGTVTNVEEGKVTVQSLVGKCMYAGPVYSYDT